MTDLLLLVLLLLALLGGFWAIAAFLLHGGDLSRFDGQTGEQMAAGQPPSPEHQDAVVAVGGSRRAAIAAGRRHALRAMREHFDRMFADKPLAATFTPVDVAGIPGEWVTVAGGDPDKRTLYIHGGAFVSGSKTSHRTLTSKFAQITGGAVLAFDYRLMPEHSRLAGIEDSRAAYRWILENGPQGASAARTVFVAGESAGGNLALALVAWVRDQGLRQADAVVALSPLTDYTLGSPSLWTNLDTDPWLGPSLAPFKRVPRTVVLWVRWIATRLIPSDPRVSPVHGDLGGLPPILVQASEAEILLDDARRYVNKAQAAGSPVKLQTWPHMVHAWHFFHLDLPEGRHAFSEIERFLAAVA